MKFGVTVLLASSLLLACSIGTIQAQGTEEVDPALQLCTPTDSVEALPGKSTISIMLGEPLKVVSTVAPITNVVHNIGGSRIQLHGLVPEGVNSHTFEPQPSDAVVVSEADLIFLNGLNLELPTLRLAEANLQEGAEIVLLGDQAITENEWIFDFSFPEENGDPNPHLWMNPLLTLRYAEIIRDELTERDPDGASFYAENYDAFAAQIGLLDQVICNVVQTIPENNRKLLTYHDSYAYFAPRYGMTVIGAIQPADFSEPSVQDVAALIDQIREEQVPAIFGSEVFPSPVVEQIGREAGVEFIETLSDDDLPDGNGVMRHHSYLQMMVDNMTTMVTALGGDPFYLNVVNTANITGPDDAVTVSQ
jgi:ABC-type Zn uptake system ZnuABC Zn-binding protein ZnuA